MEDKVIQFGNIAKEVAELVGWHLDHLSHFYNDHIAVITKDAVEHLRELEDLITAETIDIEKCLRSLKNMAVDGMAGAHRFAERNSFVCKTSNQMTDLYARKNRDYGNSFDKSMDKFGLVVAAIRIGDKVNRLQSLVAKRGVAEVKDESLADTFMDLACYSIMTMMWLRDKEKDIILLPSVAMVFTEQPPKHNASPEEIQQIKKDYGIQD